MRTLQDTGLGTQCRTVLIACELARYDIDKAALSVTRFPEEGSHVEVRSAYTFFSCGLHKVAHHILGIVFAVRTSILHST